MAGDEHQTTPIIGLEFLVPDLDDAIDVFTTALGWRLHDRQRALDVSGERAILTDGSSNGVVLTLFAASEAAEAPAVVDATPRLTQVTFGSHDVERHQVALNLLGLPTAPAREATFVDPAAMAGVWGAPAALVITNHQVTETRGEDG